MCPDRIDPQLLTSARAAPEGDGWLHEIKYDGYRLLCRLQHGRARLFSRPGRDWTAELPTLVAAMERLGIASAWFDGEMVALRADGTPDFHALQRAIGGKRGAPRLAYQVFDLLYLEGRELLGMDVLARKHMLEERVRGRSPCVRYTDHLVGSGPAFHQAAYEAGLEGIVSKRLGSRYRPGVRSRDWVKVKCMHRYVFTVAGIGKDGAVLVDEDGAFVGCAFYRQRPRIGHPVQVAALEWTPGRALRHATVLPAAEPGGTETRLDASHVPTLSESPRPARAGPARSEPFSRGGPMEKLRLNPDGLKVESFEATAQVRGHGTVEGFAGTECSKQFTCGVASRGPEEYDAVPPTRYACCV